MLAKTKAIFLHGIKYSESSYIATFYTREFGRVAYFVRGIKGKGGKNKKVLLQPLYIHNLEVDHKNNRDVQQLREMQLDVPFEQIPFDLRRQSLALFSAEVLYRVLQEEEKNEVLFDFLFHYIQLLDLLEEGLEVFHLVFMLQLSRHLGFGPNNNYSEWSAYFDLKNGMFTGQKPLHPFFVEKEDGKAFKSLMDFIPGVEGVQQLPYVQRNRLLEHLLDFYQLHMEGMGEIKSAGVLKEVFH